ncbi:hypothetical protein A4X13_0g5796 [Tilletia indica]|uniref:BTB domain-containing protein n=1 Tax=Tilletia indica TaxID=43049 RepID=A0A177TIT4_9BASI|nr:hypothetical protein A4X13_0g5796 [Tilletia indica]
MDRQHPLIAFASRWHACTGDVPPPLVGASITFVQVPAASEPSQKHLDPLSQKSTPAAAAQKDADSSSTQASAFASASQAPSAPSARLYVFGGRLVTTRRMVADLWYLDLETLVWTKIASRNSAAQSPGVQLPSRTTPSPRYFHSADVWNNKLLIFGGMGLQAAGTARSDQLVTDSISSAEGGNGKGSAQHQDDLCVLDDILAFDLVTNTWDFSFAAVPDPSRAPVIQPIARYAHLSSISSEFLIVLGGQNASNAYIERIDIFHLSSRIWVGSQTLAKQCGSYRSLVASPQLVISAGSRAPIEDFQGSSKSASLAQGSSNAARPNRAQSVASEAPSYSTNVSMDTVNFDSDRDRHRSDSTASRPSLLSVSSGTANNFASSSSPAHPTPVSDAASFRSTTESTVSLLKSMSNTGTSISLTGLVGNPAQASSANLSLHSHAGSSVLGTSHMDSEDGSHVVGSGSFLGAQADAMSRSDDLFQSPVPTYTLPMSISVQSPTDDADTGSLKFSVTEVKDDTSIADKTSAWSAPPLYLYSNYHFTDVKREIEVVSVEMRKRAENVATSSQSKDHCSKIDVSLRFQEISSAMRGTMLPPGLRFPTGAVVGEHLIVSGTYLANTSQSFSIWSLHLPTLIWTRIDLGSVLSTGSWNRAVVWPGETRDRILKNRPTSAENVSAPGRRSGHSEGRSYAQSTSGQSVVSVVGSSGQPPSVSANPAPSAPGLDGTLQPPILEDESVISRPPFTGNKLIILGHRGRDLVNDYNHRQVNCDHVIVVDLESWGIYQPPGPPFATATGPLNLPTGNGQDQGQQPAFRRPETVTDSVAQATELGLAKLRSSAQGGLVPLTTAFTGEPAGITASSATTRDNRPLRSALSPFETRLRSDSTATTSSANSARSRGQSSINSTAASSAKDDGVTEFMASPDASGTLNSAVESNTEGEASFVLTPQAPVPPLSFAPFSFGGRGDFEIICSDGLWIACDRIVLERRWPWFAERMKDYRKRAKRFAANPLGSGPQNASVPTSVPGQMHANPTGGDIHGASTGAEGATGEELDQAVAQSENTEQVRASTDPTVRLSSSVDKGMGSRSAARSMSALAAASGRSRGFTTSYLPQNGAATLSNAELGSRRDPTSSAASGIRRSPDPRITPRQLVFPEPSPIVLALLEFLYARSICTALQRHPVVLAALLVLGTTYELDDLVQWCVHAAHVVIASELSSPPSDSRHVSRNATPTSLSLASFPKSASGPFGADVYAGSALNSNDPVRNDLSIEQRHRYAVMLFEAATLCGSEALQIRALRTVMGLNKYEVGRQQEQQRRRAGAGSPGDAEGNELVDGMNRPEHGRTRASTTSVYNPKPVVTGVGPFTQMANQFLQSDGRASMDEGNEAAFGLMPNSGQPRIAGSGPSAAGNSSGSTRPRATTNPSKPDGLSSTGTGPGIGTLTSRVTGNRKRFSIFGRTMGSSSGVTASATSPNPSPSTSSVDVNSTLGGGSGSVGNAFDHMVGLGNHLRESPTDPQGRPSGESYGLPLTSPSIYGDGIGRPGNSDENASPAATPEFPISPPRTSSQPRAIRGLSASSRTPRGSVGPVPSSLGTGPMTSNDSSATGGLSEQSDVRKTGAAGGSSIAPSSGLVARLVREREASGGA